MKTILKSALLSNMYCIRQNIKNQKICAVIKANSYGHEMHKIIRILNKKADYFAVSSLAEALAAATNVKKKLLILSPLSKHELKVLSKKLTTHPLNKTIELTISSLSDLTSLIFQINSNTKIKLHLKLNCGFNRFGLKTAAQVKKILSIISKHKHLKLEGVFTHISSSITMKKECNKFLRLLKLFNKNILVHIGGAKSVNAINYLQSKLNQSLMLRTGINLYGYEGEYFTNKLKPVMKIISPVVAIQKLKKGETSGYNASFTSEQNSKIAVIKIGYADGFLRELKGVSIPIFSNFQFPVSAPQFYKVVAVCMDYIMIDITCSKNIRVGTKFEILGENNPASIYAKKLDTITYEILCNFNRLRV